MKEKINYTCKFSPTNEYTKRLIVADNGLWNAMNSMKNGDNDPYKEYFVKITKGKKCPENIIEFWNNEVRASQVIDSKKLPKSAIHSNMPGSGKSMNTDHSKLIDGDVFLMDGNHRITAAMIRGEEPIVEFDYRSNVLPEWKKVIDAKFDPIHRVKHQPHPHPLLWDIRAYRTMESCKARYAALSDNGIKNAYEIGCAEGVGLWILRQLGVNARGSEINAPARTLAQSLIKEKVDAELKPSELPQTECLILYSVLYHLLNNKNDREAWISKIKQYSCVALELSTNDENEKKVRYHHMSEYNPLEWWPNRKLLYTDADQADRETWLLWK